MIKSSSYGIYLSTSHDEWGLVGDEFERHGSQLSIQNYMDTNFYEPMNEEDNFSSRRKVNFNSNKSQEDAFII